MKIMVIKSNIMILFFLIFSISFSDNNEKYIWKKLVEKYKIYLEKDDEKNFKELITLFPYENYELTGKEFNYMFEKSNISKIENKVKQKNKYALELLFKLQMYKKSEEITKIIKNSRNIIMDDYLVLCEKYGYDTGIIYLKNKKNYFSEKEKMEEGENSSKWKNMFQKYERYLLKNNNGNFKKLIASFPEKDIKLIGKNFEYVFANDNMKKLEKRVKKRDKNALELLFKLEKYSDGCAAEWIGEIISGSVMIMPKEYFKLCEKYGINNGIIYVTGDEYIDNEKLSINESKRRYNFVKELKNINQEIQNKYLKEMKISIEEMEK